MTALDLDLSKMTASQIASLDALLHEIGQTPSKIKMQVMRAGDANCGQAEYDRLYAVAEKALEQVK